MSDQAEIITPASLVPEKETPYPFRLFPTDNYYLSNEEPLSILCIVFTVSLYISGFAVINNIRARKSTHGISILPFLTCAVSCTIWLKYALIRQDQVLIITNAFGSVLEWLYVLIYLSYLPPSEFMDRGIKRWMIVQLGFMFVILFLAARPKYDQDSLQDVLAFMVKICVFTNIANYCSPVAQVIGVLRSRSTEMLSVPMSLAYFGMTVVWLQYGLVTGKHIVVIPNSIGVVLQAITVSLFFIYPRRPAAVHTAPSKTESLTL